jgi:hypothetical protein
MAEIIKGKVTAKANKGVKLEGAEVWYSAFKPEMISGINKDDVVEITYTKKGVFLNLSKIEKVDAPKTTEAPKATGYKCEVCGAALKDGKFKKCFTCNKAAKENPAPPEAKVESTSEKKKEWTPNYNNPEKTAQIQRGNALNAAASVMSNPNLQMQETTPEALAQATKVIAEQFLDWLRAE